MTGEGQEQEPGTQSLSMYEVMRNNTDIYENGGC